MNYPPGAQYDKRAPWNQDQVELNPKLIKVEWSNGDGFLEASFDNSELDFAIDESDEMFKEIMPEGEYRYHDSEGHIVAMLDDFFGMHWLVKEGGHVKERYVFLKPILEGIAERKFFNRQ